MVNYPPPPKKKYRCSLFANIDPSPYQEQVPFHSRCVPGSKLEQTTLPEELVSRVDHFLHTNLLIDLQQPLYALLQKEKGNQSTTTAVCDSDWLRILGLLYMQTLLQ